MEITEIKSSLPIAVILSHYSLTANKNNHLKCPFHKDDKPSLRIYPATNTYNCFGCGKQGDVIQFIQDYEKCTKHEAIKKAKTLVGESIIKKVEQKPSMQTNYAELYPKFKQSLHRSKKAIAYLEGRGIYDVKLDMGYNNGTTYKHLKNCIVFPLKSENDEVMSLYGRNIGKTGTHYYTANRSGLYPGYPDQKSQVLILTESIIDSATILKYTDYNTLAMFGTNGLTKEHTEVIIGMENLKEVILFFDGDKAGNEAYKTVSEKLHNLLPSLTITKVNTPESEDINSLVQSHSLPRFGGESEILSHLISERTRLFGQDLFSSIDEKSNLDTENPEYIIYESTPLQISVLGGINLFNLDKLKVTLRIKRTDKPNPIYNIRQSNLDLYNDEQCDKFIHKVGQRLELGTRVILLAVTDLTDQLEQYRLSQLEDQKSDKVQPRILSEARKQEVITFLKSKDLLAKTGELIGKTGMVGEQNNRLLMYLVFTSRLREKPLHIISLGASGTGKTYLQERISQLIPQEHKLEITALSENALYYFERTELKNKLVLIEDLDGAQDDKIMYAIRELMSKKRISKTIPIKDNKGNLKTVTLKVEGPISLAGTTTREKVYEDNANRSILIYLDNSKEQKEQIMDYQRRASAGLINHKKEEQIRVFLQDVQLMLEKAKVRNPYATKLNIPESVFKPLRTNTHYLSFIETVTFYHQYQRERKIDPQTNQSYIETTIEDIEQANSLIQEVLLAKSDELTNACRKFLEVLKAYIIREGKLSFYAKDLRANLRINPKTLSRYLSDLSRYGYIKIIGGHPRSSGYEYEVLKANEYVELKAGIKNVLDKALYDIKPRNHKTTPEHCLSASPVPQLT